MESVSQRFGAQCHKYGADHEDFKHEAVCWMLKRENALGHTLADIGADEFEKYLARCLSHELGEHAVRLRFQASGQDPRDAYFYSIAELKALLPSVFDRSKWLEPPQYEDSSSRSKGIPSHGNNWVTTLADVAQAFDKLSHADRSLLRSFHKDGRKNVDIARFYEITEAAMSSRHTSALRRLQELLGGPRPKEQAEYHSPWNGRRAISNSHAMAQTRNQYEESN